MTRRFVSRDAVLFVIGQTVSTLGDRALWLAVGVWVKMLTGSNSAAGMTIFCYIAGTLLGPLGGMLADRVRRRPLLIVTNAAIAGLVALLLLVRDAGQLWLIYLVMFGYGALGSLITAAGTALVATMVPDADLPRVNSASQAGSQGVRLVAPLLGAGLLVAIGTTGAVVADVATFAVAIVALCLIRAPERRPVPTEQHWWAVASAGVRHLLRTVALRQLVVAALLTVTAFGFVESVVFAVVDSGLHRPPAFLGYLMTVMGIGALAAAIVAARVMERLGEGLLVGLGLASFTAGAVLLATAWLPTTLLGIALFGVSLPWINVGIVTIIQRRTPTELLGRASAGFDFLFSPLQAASIALGAVLIAVIDYRALLVAMAAMVAVAAGYLFTRPEQRRPAPAPSLVPAGREAS